VSAEDIYIISPTLKLDDTMRDLVDQLTKHGFNEEVQAFDDVLSGVQMVKERMKMQRQYKSETKLLPHILVIFEDCINCFKWIEPLAIELSSIGRHLNFSFILTS